MSTASELTEFLTNHWGDCGDLCRFTEHFSTSLIEELANLCKLGITKADAKTALAYQVYKRRTSKVRGVSKSPKLMKMDIKNAIIATLKNNGDANSPSKRSGGGDGADRPLSKKPKTDTGLVSEPTANSAPHTPVVSLAESPARSMSLPTSGPTGKLESVVDNASPREPFRDLPCPPSVSLLDAKSETSPGPSVQIDKKLRTERLSPQPLIHRKSRPTLGPHVGPELLQDLKTGQKLTSSVINAALVGYFSTRAGFFLVDSCELAKWDSDSQWSALQKPTTVSKPSFSRKLRAQMASKYLFPFHHVANERANEHWSLFVAYKTGNSNAWVLESYNSLPTKRLFARKVQDIISRYLAWLLETPIASMTRLNKDCATQSDAINCGVFLLANAAAISEERAVPTAVDTTAFRDELWHHLQPKVINPQVTPTSFNSATVEDVNSPDTLSSDHLVDGDISGISPLDLVKQSSTSGPGFYQDAANKRHIKVEVNGPKLSPVGILRQKHAQDTQVALETLDREIDATRKTVQKMDTESKACEKDHAILRQRVDQATKDLEAFDQNIKAIGEVQWLPVAGISKDTFLLDLRRGEGEAKRELEESQANLQSVAAKWASAKSSIQAYREQVHRGEVEKRELEEYWDKIQT